MAVLSELDRTRVHRGLMRYLSHHRADFPCDGFLKADLRTAINNLDDWIDANGAAIVAALEEPFRSNSGLPLKTLVFLAVAATRVSPEFAKALFGEID